MTDAEIQANYVGRRVSVLRTENECSKRAFPFTATVTGIAAYCGYDVYLRLSLDDGSTKDYWCLPRNMRVIGDV